MALDIARSSADTARRCGVCAAVLAAIALVGDHAPAQEVGRVRTNPARRSAAIAGRSSVARLSDRHPNLEGVWRFSTLTPLERPARFAGKSFLTESEARDFANQRRRETNLDRRGDTPETDLRGPSVNDFWFEAASLAIVDGHVPTSLIVDPPGQGRLLFSNT